MTPSAHPGRRRLGGLALGAVLTAALPVGAAPIAALAADAAAPPLPPLRARGTAVTIAVSDATLAAGLRAALVPRAAALGLVPRVVVLPPDALRAAVLPPTTGRPPPPAPPDLVLLGGADLAAACAAGVLREVAGGGCGVTGPDGQIVPAWDLRRAAGPLSWRDFWALARLPGKRGLPARAAGTMEIALLSDGVAARDVYATLASPAGAERAFRRLDQIRPYAAWWASGAAAIRGLASGAVLMTAAPALDLVQPGVAATIGVDWTGVLREARSWAIPATLPHPEAAGATLRLLLDPGLPHPLPAATLPDAAARPLLTSGDFWVAHTGLADRFAAWLDAR